MDIILVIRLDDLFRYLKTKCSSLKLLALVILRGSFIEALFRTISNRLFLALSSQFEWLLMVLEESIE